MINKLRQLLEPLNQLCHKFNLGMLNILCSQISPVKEEQYACLVIINWTIFMLLVTLVSALPLLLWLLALPTFWFLMAFMTESLVTIITNYE